MADAEQIKKLKALVDGLTLAEFTSDAIPNPAIQQHYKSLQVRVPFSLLGVLWPRRARCLWPGSIPLFGRWQLAP